MADASMAEAWAASHWLRPWWLLLLLPATLAALLAWKRQPRRGGWQGVVAPALLPHLLLGQGRRRWIRPLPCLWALLVLASLALAGPSWRREAQPGLADDAPMMIALDLSTAAAPRLDAARRKIRDLMAMRGTARTGLLAYAGTAHLVLPPTADATLLGLYLDALAPGLMPRDGDDPAAALRLARHQLERQRAGGTDKEGVGTILLLTSRVPAAAGDGFAAALRGSRHAVLVLATGNTAAGALDGARGATRIAATPDDADLQAVLAAARRHVAAATAQDPDLRWRDSGYAIAWLLLPLALLWSRRGFLLPALLVGLLSAPALAQSPSPGQEHFGWLARWFLTDDQRGRLAYERGDFAAAMDLFSDPAWRGAAAYRAGDYARAIAEFSALDTPEAWFNRGNAALLQPHAWQAALDAYDRALALRPDFPAAQANRAIASAFLAYQQALDAERARQSSDQMNEKADATVVDRQGPQPPPPRPGAPPAPQDGLSDSEITALWMRRVGGSPADFLRRRFAEQLEEAPP
ncbi:VWA domain-containing protein [Pseudoroseomonas ludipueritiae]|uniref:VWA domain-containing protein n=1 Tax=Pseudoroseomonas ludipueritiae TaxID=198093 RepID=A0ABR7R1X9_9PROT|nr:VWA domain-containing protein [Pseudoroseomonas ludipueritiae]MBC9175677.1 VWA domain-containing protein [Pseudoroseomonas ludipueritiae]